MNDEIDNYGSFMHVRQHFKRFSWRYGINS